MPDKQLQNLSWASTLTLSLKHISSPDLLNVFETLIIPSLQKLYHLQEDYYLSATFNYLLEGNFADPDKLVKIIERNLSTQWGEHFMSLANRLRQEGRQAGRQEGRQEGERLGLQEGYLKAQREIARNMINQGTPIELVFKTTGLPADMIWQLMAAPIDSQ